jgi:L-alanine-DL-glutamate epimerase-like enolase superfamily enzyme
MTLRTFMSQRSLVSTSSAVSGVDTIRSIRVRSTTLPLPMPISDAKVLTGRQKPMTEVAMLFAEVTTESGLVGLGFSYSKRAGGPAQFAHAHEVAPVLIGEDPNDIARLWTKLVWAGASVGRSGASTQAIAAIDNALWDLKGKRAGLSISKLLGAQHNTVRTYNTSGGFLHTPIEGVLDNATKSIERGLGGIKIKVGQPDTALDLSRVRALREHVGDSFPIMVDANQQWDRPTAMRMGRALEEFNLVWIEEPLDAYDVVGHADLAARLDTAIASGEMLTSVREHQDLIAARAVDIIQPDAPRIGGITQFVRLLALADEAGLDLAPHFAMELHVHLASTYPREPWVEHFEWLEPLFNERIDIADGRMVVPTTPGVGLTLSDRVESWTVADATITE